MTHKPTEAVSDLIQSAEYMVGNPSAWDSYDERASEIIRALIRTLRSASGVSVGAVKALGLDGEWDDYHKGIPVAAKLAAVRAYVAKAGSCRPVAMIAALQAAAPILAPSPAREITEAQVFAAMAKADDLDLDLNSDDALSLLTAAMEAGES